MIPGLPQVGTTELLILLLIILLLFGAKRIPRLARSLGSGLGEFRKGLSGRYDDEVDGEYPGAERSADDLVSHRHHAP